MLGIDYTDQFNELVESVPWTIQLPETWGNFFSERGECQTYSGDGRKHRRMKARSYGMLWIQEPCQAIPRPVTAHGVYTKDFSQRGCGLISPIEIYPDEVLRVVLPTFWLTIRVTRCCRVQAHCFEVGAVLIRQSAPSDDAYDLQNQRVAIGDRF